MNITPEISAFAMLAIGFVLGLQHAVEADHLAAVSTIVSEKKGLWTASIVGGLWGIGHTIALLAVATTVIFLRLQISETLESRVEAIVGAMLILLGANALRKLFQKSSIHIHTHEHDGRLHTHIHSHTDGKTEVWHHRFSLRSMVVGMIHGLAGSGALMFLILPGIDSPGAALAYIAVFGLGSIVGMMAMSFLVGLPFHLTAGKFNMLNRGTRLITGLISVGFGGFIVYEHLLTA